METSEHVFKLSSAAAAIVATAAAVSREFKLINSLILGEWLYDVLGIAATYSPGQINPILRMGI